VLWSLGLTCERFSLFAEAVQWGVSVLAAENVSLAGRFARAEGSALAEHELDPLAGAPTLAGSVSRFCCRTHETRELGDHLLIVGLVEALESHHGDALTFYRGRYARVADPTEI
jgi:flavin reductase (DIM6/NTAB) family NADH-FMN oxidoreductase RutF